MIPYAYARIQSLQPHKCTILYNLYMFFLGEMMQEVTRCRNDAFGGARKSSTKT